MAQTMDLGSKLKEVRRGKQITLQEVARETGLSKSFISQVEAGGANPSIGSLKKIADALAVPLAELFESEANGTDPGARAHPDGDRDRPNDVRVVRSNRRKMLVWPGEDSKHYLVSPDVQRKLEVTFNELQPGYDSEVISHHGEECGFVIEGMLEMTVGGETFVLNAGDSIYFPSHLPHRERVLGDDLTRTFWVNTPPTY
jgi:transcriptional regulator with XRE-family HTH domain